MRFRHYWLVLGALVILRPDLSSAGGLLLPGSGAISTSRAGAAVASTDDGEALGINPAGLAKTNGTTITVSMAIIGYSMEFTRTGAYDPIAAEDRPYEGQAYETVTNDPDLPLGIGKFQPIPVIAVTSDLGGKVKGLRAALGLYAPNAYPFRDMSGGYVMNADFNKPPPVTRYDILEQKAALLFPSLGVAYRILPELDVGVRLSWGIANIESVTAVWGTPANYEEAVTHDAELTAKVSDNFVPTFGIGALYRPTPFLEFGLNYSYASVVRASGTATNVTGPEVLVNMQPTTIGPIADEFARCAKGGTFEEQKICVDFQLPMSLQLGGRYKFLDDNGAMKGDIELNVGWENWGKRCADSADFASGCTSPGQYRVVVDATAYIEVGGVPTPSIDLKDSIIEHRFKDTWNFRLGGSYVIPVGGRASENSVIVRGGLGYDTRAAQEGWLRADIDGASRVTATVGASYKTHKWQVSAGFGAIIEGENTNGGSCNPTPTGMMTRPGCGPGDTEQPFEDRDGLDPISPITVSTQQAESPVNQGTFNSNYLLFMLGFNTWF